jgi:hypothetical protein
LTQLGSQKNTLFRDRAIQKLNTLDPIELNFQVIKPTAWLWILTTLCFFISLGTWGAWGKASSHVIANGIVLSTHQLEQTERQMQEGIQQRKFKLSALKMLLEKKRQLFNKKYLTTADMKNAEDEYFSAKEDLIRFSNKGYTNTNMSVFSPDESGFKSDLNALVFVSNQEGKKIRAGMKSLLIPNTLSAFKYGYIQGTVTNISQYPASKDAIYAYLGNMNLVDEFFSGGVPFMVKIKLEKNPLTVSGLNWTTRRGAPFKIESGTGIVAKITHKTSSPISLLIKNDDT